MVKRVELSGEAEIDDEVGTCIGMVLRSYQEILDATEIDPHLDCPHRQIVAANLVVATMALHASRSIELINNILTDDTGGKK